MKSEVKVMRRKLCIVLCLLVLIAALPCRAADDDGKNKNNEFQTLNDALLAAVEKGDVATASTLLDKGANVNARGINDTALQTAIFHGDVAMAQLLLDKGAKIEAGDLADAARGVQGDRAKAGALVRLLLEKGADLKVSGADALQTAARESDIEIMKLLLDKGVSPEAKNEAGDTALMYAFDEPVMKLLLDKGASVDAKNTEGQTPLMRLALAGNMAAVQLLLARKAAINLSDSAGKTALHYAVRQFGSEAGIHLASPAVVRVLLDHGAKVNAGDNAGNTALMDTVGAWPGFEKEQGPTQIVKLLLAQGANANLQNHDGETALMIAVRRKRGGDAQVLLETGSHFDLKNKKGETALHIAQQMKARALADNNQPGAEAAEYSIILLQKAGARE